MTLSCELHENGYKLDLSSQRSKQHRRLIPNPYESSGEGNMLLGVRVLRGSQFVS